MNIGKYKIESDSLNVTLSKKGKNRKTGTETWKICGYFSSPKFALNHLVNLEVMETGMADITTVVQKIEELRKLIQGLKFD